jgi:hypothetical protein
MTRLLSLFLLFYYMAPEPSMRTLFVIGDSRLRVGAWDPDLSTGEGIWWSGRLPYTFFTIYFRDLSKLGKKPSESSPSAFS